MQAFHSREKILISQRDCRNTLVKGYDHRTVDAYYELKVYFTLVSKLTTDVLNYKSKTVRASYRVGYALLIMKEYLELI
jgi:hypothetical protein